MSLPSKPEYEIIVADTPELKKESLDVRNAGTEISKFTYCLIT